MEHPIHHKRILVLVEDEPMIAELYRTVFETKPYVVHTAFNKERAQALIAAERPDIVLLDLMIPFGAGEPLITYDHPVGFDILEWVRHDPTLRKTRVIVLTNLESDEYRRHAESLGVAGYFVKANLEPQDIIRHVDAAMRLTTV